jgi:hypothetical protein
MAYPSTLSFDGGRHRQYFDKSALLNAWKIKNCEFCLLKSISFTFRHSATSNMWHLLTGVEVIVTNSK